MRGEARRKHVGAARALQGELEELIVERDARELGKAADVALRIGHDLAIREEQHVRFVAHRAPAEQMVEIALALRATAANPAFEKVLD